jgi:hypothetical protein
MMNDLILWALSVGTGLTVLALAGWLFDRRRRRHDSARWRRYRGHR